MKIVKIRFESDIKKLCAGENPWAEDLGGDKYRIVNILFFVNGITISDIVEAHRDHEGILNFTKLVKDTGKYAVRICLAPNHQNEQTREKLHLFFWTDVQYEFERGFGFFYCVCCPPSHFDNLIDFLEAGYKEGYWFYELAKGAG